MIALLLGLALGAPVRFDRVDLLSETSGTWLHDELPRSPDSPRVVALRWVEQVQPVIALPPAGLQLGLALRTQSIRYERSLDGGPWALNGGVQLGALLPNGLVGGAAWRRGPVRIGVSMSAVSRASWANPSWTGWRWLPTLGVGLGPARDDGKSGASGRPPWM